MTPHSNKTHHPSKPDSDKYASILGGLVIPDDVINWLRDDAATSDRTEQAARQQAIDRLDADIRCIDARIETMYTDKLDGRRTAELYDRKAREWRAPEADLRRRKEELTTAKLGSVDDAIDLMTATGTACDLFRDQPPTTNQTATPAPIRWGDAGRSREFESTPGSSSSGVDPEENV